MLSFYLFLYVFSLSIPVFYHSAFLVGGLSLVHLILKGQANSLRKLTNYQLGYFLFFIFGFVLVYSIVVLHSTYDFSFFKTYINSFLSALCGIPLVHLYFNKYKDKSVDVLFLDLFNIFFVQSLIIVLAMLIPSLKPFVNLFHRDSESAMDIDIFSGGLRTNALSGGLFFGLALSFGFALLCFLYVQSSLKEKVSIKKLFYFIMVNIGLMCTGRFGFVYLVSAFFIFISFGFFKKIRSLFYSVFFIFVSLAILFFFYNYFDAVRDVFDNKIYPYFFELLKVYLETGEVKSASTNDLVNMYNINFNDYTLFLGDGLYTGSDGLYYQHSDVGYIRLLLLGGVPLLLYMILFFLFSINPIKKYRTKSVFFYYAVLSFFIISQFKGEAMITLVSLNNMVFLICSLISLNKGKYAYNERNNGLVGCRGNDI
ncbi:hypothetical protein [Pectobacterium aquaticum]|uniref:O-antigen polymerase n=1 Tax=Pectobacterium aquaticum TaxID=2204145 RepID=A0A3R8PTQ4_9GAMM|nr:hypothetical protein [Pectobacterium aquaticum]RRO06020.1 hypothetical protein DMB85_016725 [Pectobacterium aquaticum]